METLNLILLLLFFTFILIPALISLAILGVAAAAVKNKPTTTTTPTTTTPTTTTQPTPTPPLNLKPSPKTLKYICPESGVCDWKTTQSSERTCAAKRTDKCNPAYVNEECKKLRDVLSKRQEYTQRVSFKRFGIYEGEDELTCSYDYDFVLPGAVKCKWSAPDPNSGSIRVTNEIACGPSYAIEYCESTGGILDTSKGMICNYKNPA
jgi:hypothetical protein